MKKWLTSTEGMKLLSYKNQASVNRLATRYGVRTKPRCTDGRKWLYFNAKDLLEAYNKTSLRNMNHKALPTFPKYDTFLRLEGDFVVICDAHCPFVDKEFFEQLLHIRDKWGVSKLILAGDTMNCAAFSRFPSIFKTSWQTEREVTLWFLEQCAKEFDHTYVLTANHEMRYLLKLNVSYDASILQNGGELDIWQVAIAKLDTNYKNKITFSIYPYCLVNDLWRITHPQNARKQPLSLSRELSIINGQNIILAHAHMSGWSYAPDGEHELFDCGIFSNPLLHDYKCMRDTPHYKWTESFIIIKDNEGHIFRKGIDRPVV